MKSLQVLKFFATIVVLLATMALLFPRQGIGNGNNKLRFPTLHSVLSGHNATNTGSRQSDKAMNDTVASICSQFFASGNRIWLPDDNIDFFDTFFERADNAANQGRTLRIVHYGDSQIEGDRITSQLRSHMQQLFGGGGPGMLPLKQTVPSFSVSQTLQGNTIGQSTYGGKPMVRTHGDYGPMLRSWRVDGKVTIDIKATNSKSSNGTRNRFSNIKLLVYNRPGPTSATLDGNHRQVRSEEGLQTIEWRLDSAVGKVQLTLEGHSDIYGIMVDNGAGVAVDNVAMRGVSGQQFTMVDSTKLALSYSKMDVGMIVMQFGGNSVPWLKDNTSIDNYCKKLGRQIDYLHHVCPEATILFIGPSDMSTKVDGELGTYPLLPRLVEQLRATANAHGAAFWSIYHVMGGNGSMIDWLNNGLAEHDYIHFNRKGAAIVGDSLNSALQRMYDIYKLKNNS